MHKHGQYFGFEIPESIYINAVETINQILAGGPNSDLNAKVAESLIDITEVGFEAYYQKPSELVNISPVVRKAADAGINAVRKGVHIVIRKVFSRMPNSELKVLAQYMANMINHDNAETNRRFYITFALNDRLFELAQTLLARVRTDPELENYRDDIVQSLLDLIDAGVDAYYREPVGMISMSKLTRKTADLGISTAQKGTNSVVHRLFKVMPHEELIPLASYFETLLHTRLQPHTP